MMICEEMKKLRAWLDEQKITWKDVSNGLPKEALKVDGVLDWWICRTHFWVNGYHFSVINGHGSYGGYMLNDEKNQGLLEMMIGNHEPTGYMTADDCIKEIKNYLKY
jgi:hypothetical protein